MTSKNTRGYMSNVDEMVEQTPLDLVLSNYGLPLTGDGTEYRMKCVFNEACSDSQYGNLSVKLDVAKALYCHVCNVRGNLLTLIHGLETHQPPTGGRLRGQEFKNAVSKLKEINGVIDSPSSHQAPRGQKGMGNGHSTPEQKRLPSGRGNQEVSNQERQPAEISAFSINVPLLRHEKEAARALADLNEELVTDIAMMSPEAAAYIRKREDWLTPELMQEWGIGWIPGNGRSLFRKHYIVSTHRNTRGDIVSYSGRDVNFDAKWQKWLTAGKPGGKKPNKHRYVSGFKRGAELYGGQASRLKETYVKESLAKHGVVVVESANNVMRMADLGVCAVGLCSNKATEQQIEMVSKFAKQVANNRVMLLPDCDEQGEAGFKELLWRLAENGLDVKLGLSSQMFDGQFAGKQPEDLSVDDWKQITGM